MKITLDIPDSEIEAALRTAAEQGIGDWAKELWWPDRAFVKGATTGYVIEHGGSRDASKHVRHELDVERGLRMMYQGAGNKDIVNRTKGVGKGEMPSYWDADQADCFVQYAAFGEVRYG